MTDDQYTDLLEKRPPNDTKYRVGMLLNLLLTTFIIIWYESYGSCKNSLLNPKSDAGIPVGTCLFSKAAAPEYSKLKTPDGVELKATGLVEVLESNENSYRICFVYRSDDFLRVCYGDYYTSKQLEGESMDCPEMIYFHNKKQKD